MKLTLKLAEETEIKPIQTFFKRYLNKNNPGIVNGEFLCPFWVSSAIKRKQMIVLKNWFQILGALRFYPKKTDNIVSLYQFALSEKIRWKWLIKTMIWKTWYKSFEINCFLNSDFNEYYNKTWWKLEKSDNKFNYWIINI